MKQAIEFLKKDRNVNDAFIKRLESVGLEVKYGTYDYWNGQPYVQIGDERVYLVETIATGTGGWCLCERKQNDVLHSITDTIEREMENAKKSDTYVEEWFEKYNRKGDDTK